MARRLVLLTSLLTASCASAPAPQPAPASAPATMPDDIHWVRNSAEYRAIVEQTFRLATAALERRAAGRAPGSWAVAVDADETLISNSEQSVEQWLAPDEPFHALWNDWVERRAAPALPGARAFLERVRQLGGRIAVVTNRRERHCPQTADNLRALELPFDVILCRGDDPEKEPRWRRVESGTASPDLPPLEIVMWLGDNIHDFPGLDQELRFAPSAELAEFGDRFFVLPNPMYGSWEDNPPE